MASRVVVGRARDVADGEHIIVTVHNRSIGIYNVGGQFYGLLNRCPHKGAELCRFGRLRGHLTADRPHGEIEYDGAAPLLTCPWHGWEFDVRTGQSYFDPVGVRTRRYGVEAHSAQAVKDGIAQGTLEVTPEEYGATEQWSAGDAVAGRVPGPYLAETIDVCVEDEFLVIDLAPARSAAPGRSGAQ